MELPRSFRTQTLLAAPIRSPLGTISLAGCLRESPGVGATTMRVLGKFALVYLVHGKGTYRDTRGTRVPLESGSMIFILPDIGHTYGPLPDSPWNEIYFIFEGPVFDLWRKQGLLSSGSPVIHLEPMEYWFQRVSEVIQREVGPSASTALSTIGRFQSFIIDALAAAQQATDGATRNAWLETSERLLAERFRDSWLDPREVAAKVGMSYDNFRKQFSRLTGVPPQQFQKKKRIEHACAAIYQGDKSLKEIAAELEFCDVFHFSKAFKQIVGSSPSAFRNRVLGR